MQGCTHASLVPTQLWRLLNTHQRIALKAVLLGGAAIPVELTQQARAQGISTFCGYGLTEFASTVCAKEADGEPDVGSALPGREVQVVNGEVWIKAQSMASGYWRDGALLPLTNSEGWFATRDRGELHDGRLTILGRMDNLFSVEARAFSRRALSGLSRPIRTSAVFIVPLNDAEFGQRPVAVVECEPGTDITRLPEWVQGKLARFEQPVHWLVLPAELKMAGLRSPAGR